MPIQLPMGQEIDSGIINLMKAYKFDGKMGEVVVEMDIPESHMADAQKWHDALIKRQLTVMIS